MSAPVADRRNTRFSEATMDGRSFRIDFGVSPKTPAMTRMMVRFILAEWQVRTEIIDVAELLASGLATNAVRFGSTRRPHGNYVPYISLALRHAGGLALVEVSDESEKPPEMRVPDQESDHGRGLILVDELSGEWSYYYPRPGWKTVYFVIDASAGDQPGGVC
jgi:anti-sigma regulatory factor (Ser/Thr protein kinase)